MNFIMLYEDDSCCNVDLLIFNTGFLSVCLASTRAEECLSHSAESRTHSPLWRLWGSTSREEQQEHLPPHKCKWERSACLRLILFILYKNFFYKIVFFFSQLYVHILFKDSVFQFWKFFLDYFSTTPSLLLLFYLELVLFSYGILWAVLKFCCYYFPIFFCPAVILLKISSTYISIVFFISTIICL